MDKNIGIQHNTINRKLVSVVILMLILFYSILLLSDDINMVKKSIVFIAWFLAELTKFITGIFKHNTIESIKGNIILTSNHIEFPIKRYLFNLRALFILVSCGTLFPLTRKLRLYLIAVGLFLILAINILQLNYCVNYIVSSGRIPSISMCLPFSIIAEYIPLFFLFVVYLKDKSIFLRIKNQIIGLEQTEYLYFVILVSISVCKLFFDLTFIFSNYFFEIIPKLLTVLILNLSNSMIHQFGFSTHIYGNKIFGENTFVFILDGCLGLKTMTLYAIYILLFKENNIRKFKYITIGIFFIIFLNSLRIAALYMIYYYYKTTRFLFLDHHDLYNLMIYIIIFIICFFWTRKAVRYRSENYASCLF